MRFLAPLNLYMTNMLVARALMTTPLPYDEGLPYRAGRPAYTRGPRTSRQYHLRAPTVRTFRCPRSLGVPSDSLLRLPERQAPMPRLARSASLLPATIWQSRQLVPSTARAVIRTLEDPLHPTSQEIALKSPTPNGQVPPPTRSIGHPGASLDRLPPVPK